MLGAWPQVRMLHRYLDIRRNPIKEGLLLRNRVTKIIRDYLGAMDFCEVGCFPP